MKRQLLFWLPRSISLLFAAFVMLFSFDVFDGKSVWYTALGGFMIHNIPVWAMLLLLWLTRRRPAIAAIFYFLLAVGLAAIVRTNGYISTLLIFLLPPLLVGGLFLWEYLFLAARKDGQ